MSTSIEPNTPPLPAEAEENPPTPEQIAAADAYVARILRWSDATMVLTGVRALSGGALVATAADVLHQGSDVLARQGVRLEWTREVVEAVILAGQAALPDFQATLLPVAAAVFLVSLPVGLLFPRPTMPPIRADAPEA